MRRQYIIFLSIHSYFNISASRASRTMIANRISYWLNVKSPSYNVDASCSSSVVALEIAHQAIMHGHCDAAIVGAARLLLHPAHSIHYRRQA